MIEVGQRRRNQPAPPWAVHDALVDPGRDAMRQRLTLAADEQPPQVVEAVRPQLVVWSSLCPSGPMC